MRSEHPGVAALKPLALETAPALELAGCPVHDGSQGGAPCTPESAGQLAAPAARLKVTKVCRWVLLPVERKVVQARQVRVRQPLNSS